MTTNAKRENTCSGLGALFLGKSCWVLAHTLPICHLSLSKTFLYRWHTSLLSSPWLSWDLYPHQKSFPWLPYPRLKESLPMPLFLLKRFSLAKPSTRWPQSQEIFFVFAFLCLWAQVIWGNCLQLQIPPATTEKEEEENSLSLELRGGIDILNSGRKENRASLKPLTFLVGVVSTSHSYFRMAAELISIVSNWSIILW